MSNHECKQVISKVYLALDGGLSEEEEKAFLADLQECSCCLDHYNIENVFKQFLAEKVERHKVNQNTISLIKSKIAASSVSK